MPLVPPVAAALAGGFLFLVPGLVFLALLDAEDRRALSADEAAFLAVAVSVALSAWVGLVLAELGHFSLLGAAGLLAAGSLAALAIGRRRLGPPFPRPQRIASLAPGLLVLAMAFGLQARPTEYLLGGRDPGTYVASMALIGRTGGILYVDPLVLDIPAQDLELFYRHPRENQDFSWGRFMGFPLERPQTGRVYPEFFHLFPAFGAFLFQALGVRGALATPPIFGVLGTLAVFFAARRIFGPAVALVAASLLALNAIQVWFARYPVSEPVSQFLFFLALLALAHWEQRGAPAFGLLAGAALGLSLLVRIDSLLIVAPLGVYLLVRRAHHDLPWRRALPLLAPFGLLALHAALHGLVFSRKYVLNIVTRPYWHQPLGVWLLLGLGVLLCLLAAHRLGPSLIQLLERHERPLRLAVSAAVVGLALYAYFLRPQLSAWAGGDGNPKAAALPDPSLLVALGFKRLAAHDAQALVRLGWFLTAPGLGLAVAGLLLALGERREVTRMFLLSTLTFSLFYFYKIRVWNDYFFAMRRYVPVVLPAFAVGIALVLVALWRRGGGLRVAGVAAGCWLLFAFGRQTAPLARYVDWRDAVAFVADVARRFGPDDVVIFEQRASIHLLSLPLWAVHGVKVLELARFNPDPRQLEHLIAAWRGKYKNVYFVKTYRTDLCGIFLQRIEEYAFGTYEWERTFDRPPARKEARALRFTLQREVPPEQLRVPALPEVDIGGSDDFQVSGFYEKEGGEGRTFRWTGSCGSVYLPGAHAGDALTLVSSVGKRPAASIAAVKVSLSGTVLGSYLAGPGWDETRLRLPDPLPPGPPILRLDVPAFRPSNVWPGDPDGRDLGVMLDRIRLTPAAGH